MQLRCTKKVLDQFNIKEKDLSEPKSSQAILGNWYVNLVTIDRRKTLIFMSERTLLSFLIYGVRKDNSKNIHELFIRGLAQLLDFEGFSASQIEVALNGAELLTISKTHNPKALGNLNDLAKLYDHSIYYDWGYKNCDVFEIMKKLNRMPQRNIGWNYSIDVARELINEYQ